MVGSPRCSKRSRNPRAMALARRCRPFHRLPADLRRRELAQDVQDLQRRGAAGGAGRERQVDVAIAPGQHGLDEHAVAGEVLARDETAVGRHVVGDGLGDGAAIERVRPFLGDQLQAARQVRIRLAIARQHPRRPVAVAAVAKIVARRHGKRRPAPARTSPGSAPGTNPPRSRRAPARSPAPGRRAAPSCRSARAPGSARPSSRAPPPRGGRTRWRSSRCAATRTARPRRRRRLCRGSRGRPAAPGR